MDHPEEELMECLRRAYEYKEHSDLTIKCRGATYNVHKILVCPRSDFFAAACRWPSPANDEGQKRKRTGSGGSPSGYVVSPESGIKVVNLDDDDPIAVWAMVEYLYHLEYPTPTDEMEQEVLRGWEGTDLSSPGGSQASNSSKVEDNPSGGDQVGQSSKGENNSQDMSWRILHRHAKIYSLSEKFGISGLKYFASDSFAEASDSDHVGRIHGTWEDRAACVREVYTATPNWDRELRDATTTILRNRPNLLESKRMQELMLEIPQVALDVLLEYLDDERDKKSRKKTTK